MLPLERAAKLKREADVVLKTIDLFNVLLPFGKVFPTGSYFLDVMAYPDIDLYLARVSLEQIFAIGAQIAKCELVSQVVFEKTDDLENLPDGLYLKFRYQYGEWGRPWKIDIWSLDEAVIENKLAVMEHFRQKMTADLREQIIRYKLSVMTSDMRTPMYSGFFIYKAFLEEGLTDFNSVTHYLIKCGIHMNTGGQARAIF